MATAYDRAGNLVSDGTFTYTYNAQNRLVKGENADGESSSYTYNALGVRIENVQVRENQNAGNQNADLTDGSHGTDYLPFLSDLRATWQRAWETQVGTVAQNDFETVTKHYVADYLSPANRDILVTEDGSFTQRYVYDADGKRLSVELGYADGTVRGATNASGEYGENPQSDIAASIHKAWYRTSHLNSTLFAVEADGSVVAHMIYDPFGKPLLETYTDTNYSGLDNLNNFTGYTYDEVLGLYYAQNRFYDATTHRFTQEDAVKDGGNWYAYCGNDPLNYTDPNGYFLEELQSTLEGHGWKTVEELAEDGERWANWRNILYENSVVRINRLPKYQTEAARNAAVDNIYYEEAEKLQKEFKTLYHGSASFTLLHKTLQPLYTDFERPKESHDLREVALQGFLGGFDTGLKTAPFLDKYFPKAQCPDAGQAASGGGSGADDLIQYEKLKEYYRQAEKYGTGSIKELEDGRIRFYEELKPARTSGEMAGARHVREWNPTTGVKRDWYETLDHSGNIRQVRPDPNITGGTKVHYMFDSDGNYIGSWTP